ncbi:MULTISPECIES: thermonuclease family protein [unclassified Maridesulfovibrio]|uniref:thermonuclease family protein n=1 Tax=unclassified Maridesulfovibrio TaxID=2794999 RepID=UPI003B42B54D
MSTWFSYTKPSEWKYRFACSDWPNGKDVYAASATVSRVVSVYDGDTFTADIDEFPPLIGKKIGIRVAGIDTPEMRDKRIEIKALAVKARDYVRAVLAQAKVIELRNLRRGKYFRIVADVYVDGASLAEGLLSLGLAHPYDGGRKVGW